MFNHCKLRFTKINRNFLNALERLKKESWRNTHTTPFINDDDQSRWYESLDDDILCPRNLVLKVSEGSLDIGVFKILNINYVNRSADVAWDVFFDHRGKGYGKNTVAGGVLFCFDLLNLRRLSAEILAHNHASIRCAENAGFKVEGKRIQAVYKCGEYIDSIIYGVLK